MLLEPAEVAVCWVDPGFDTDLSVTADCATLHNVWIGRQTLATALAKGQIKLEGPKSFVRDFPNWLALSTFAHIAPARPAAPAASH
jgi:hypothetical protein